jgi:hypothetical protein
MRAHMQLPHTAMGVRTILPQCTRNAARIARYQRAIDSSSQCWRTGSMATLARFSVGRVFLRLLALVGNRNARLRVAGIVRKLPWVTGAPTLLVRARIRLIGAFVRYLARPMKNSSPQPNSDPKSLLSGLNRGDVLLSHSNTRVATLIRRITQSPWSHVSIYVGPLDDGPDPPCVVEADMTAGVRSIRLSELNAMRVRVLRPVGLNDIDRSRLVDWVVSRIGCEYDLTHAWRLGQHFLRLPLPRCLRSSSNTITGSTTRFICCSLLAHAFALVEYPILPEQMEVSLSATIDRNSLTPGDFERASGFAVVGLN